MRIIEGLKGNDRQRKSANAFLHDRAAEFSEVFRDIIRLPQKSPQDTVLISQAKYVHAALIELVSDSTKAGEAYRRLEYLAKRLE